MANSARYNLAGKGILELGCGEEDRARLFYRAFNEVIGIDILKPLSSSSS